MIRPEEINNIPEPTIEDEKKRLIEEIDLQISWKRNEKEIEINTFGFFEGILEWQDYARGILDLYSDSGWGIKEIYIFWSFKNRIIFTLVKP